MFCPDVASRPLTTHPGEDVLRGSTEMRTFFGILPVHGWNTPSCFGCNQEDSEGVKHRISGFVVG